ncbi:minichromosome maintenance domain-containing protein 2 [Toxorhynchites rutilus septentrionalis]|uniref:minichromosome maintenance domain-containing protein 2 n=1 Tax=Toxorhynchites rutilus septentrionalis TaxID=329112 RepID=UPI002478A6E1|nr:minichromosome maintenance domain-containing protein 2 [Toxorhynchites rutilus septentrionalis]
MESTLGLVSDPDELELASMIPMGNLESLIETEVEPLDINSTTEPIQRNYPSDLATLDDRTDRTVITTQNICVSLDKLSEKEEDTPPQSPTLGACWEPSPIFTNHDNSPERPADPTMAFDSVEPSQEWAFSQIQPSLKQRLTQDSPQLTTTQGPGCSIDVKPEDTQTTTQLYQELPQIPASIRNLYSSVREQYNDYCFTYMLAAHLCQNIVPMSAYNELKLSLLLSIASIQRSPGRLQPFHVICLGADTAVAHLLMRSVGQLARRFVIGSFELLAGGRVLAEDNFVECGATTLARTGVCYIGDWAMQKPSNEIRILREIETGQVIIENHPIAYPLECAIWTHWSYSRRAKQDLNALVVFLNVFGIPIVLPEQPPNSVVDFILERSLLDTDPADQETVVPEEDFRQLLAMLYFQEITIPEEVDKLLSDYFVASRLIVQESLTQSSFSTLRKLTEAHARLCFRTEASNLDAVVAIMICESFIHTVFTDSTNRPPLSDNFESIEDLNRHFQRFAQWLAEFLKRTIHI